MMIVQAREEGTSTAFYDLIPAASGQCLRDGTNSPVVHTYVHATP